MKKEHAEQAGTKAAKTLHGEGRSSTGKQRMTALRKQEAVLRLMKGEDMELIARSFGVSAADVSRWHERFIAGGISHLRSQASDARAIENNRLHAKVGELTMTIELLDEKIEKMEAGRPFVRRRSKR